MTKKKKNNLEEAQRRGSTTEIAYAPLFNSRSKKVGVLYGFPFEEGTHRKIIHMGSP